MDITRVTMIPPDMPETNTVESYYTTFCPVIIRGHPLLHLVDTGLGTGTVYSNYFPQFSVHISLQYTLP